MILDGKTIRREIEDKLRKKITDLSKLAKRKPMLAIIQVGSREDSNAYIRQKTLCAESIGAGINHMRYPETITEKEIIAQIEKLNSDKKTDGVILQIPIPQHLSKTTIIESIAPEKDVDGLTAVNIKKLYENDPTGHVPATTRGIMTLLNHYKIAIEGKKVVVVGRSGLVGRPTALAFINENGTVTVCHSKTLNLQNETMSADILIAATGHPHLIGKNYVRSGQVVIDVGINLVAGTKLEEEIPGKKFVGDVDFENVKNVVSAISPVPGGVGPLTVASLFENLVSAFEKSLNLV